MWPDELQSFITAEKTSKESVESRFGRSQRSSGGEKKKKKKRRQLFDTRAENLTVAVP